MEKLEALSKEELITLVTELRTKLLTATQNLGHPAYNVSSSTTFGIDELREELFDYLEVPK